MPGVDPGQHGPLRLVQRGEQRDEVLGGSGVVDQPVHPRDDVGQLEPDSAHGAHRSLEIGHEEGRPDTLPRDVAHRDYDPAVGQRDEVVEIPRDIQAEADPGGQLETRDFRHHQRQQALLYPPRYLELLLEPLLLYLLAQKLDVLGRYADLGREGMQDLDLGRGVVLSAVLLPRQHETPQAGMRHQRQNERSVP